MIIKLWGVRGSIPAPQTNREYHKKIRDILRLAARNGITEDSIQDFMLKLPLHLKYQVGGNTTSVTFQSSRGKIPIFLDGGTGIRNAQQMLKNSGAFTHGEKLRFFFSHTHWDHIQGLPFFTPIYIPGNTFEIYSAYDDMEERLRHQFEKRFFPVSYNDLNASFIFHTIQPGETLHFPEENLVVKTIAVRHPGGSLAYRFEIDGTSFIFATDVEFTGDDLSSMAQYNEFFKNGNLLLIDSQYTLDESFNRFDWGHTSNTMAVNCAIRWKIANLVLTHHEPAHSDEHKAQDLMDAIEHKNNQVSDKPRIILAREGMEFCLGDDRN